MAKRFALSDIRKDCERILSMWNANPSFQLSDLNKGQFEELVRQMDRYTTLITDAETRLITDRLKRQELFDQASRLCSRVRSMARGFFGPDTPQLNQTGHTILSERKSPSRKSWPGTDLSSSKAA